MPATVHCLPLYTISPASTLVFARAPSRFLRARHLISRSPFPPSDSRCTWFPYPWRQLFIPPSSSPSVPVPNLLGYHLAAPLSRRCLPHRCPLMREHAPCTGAFISHIQSFRLTAPTAARQTHTPSLPSLRLAWIRLAIVRLEPTLPIRAHPPRARAVVACLPCA